MILIDERKVEEDVKFIINCIKNKKFSYLKKRKKAI